MHLLCHATTCHAASRYKTCHLTSFDHHDWSPPEARCIKVLEMLGWDYQCCAACWFHRKMISTLNRACCIDLAC
ncbi:hypothetical protein EJ03DRAFT_214558 [Teratosphaeria nubilosa]|uniref:Uncharacterized protein n=1 Tax=Teratosphaeria nubilosa TaxID=161662 RepID=A0A6G1LGS2_9PEZI|nr:hypothetical protein EJ03DRAFT_214558 [Teratosphaeria nubilosa]